MQARSENNSYVNLVRVTGGVSWQELLTELGTKAQEMGLANEGIVDALIQRETGYPTGIAAEVGIAMPHAESEFTARESVLVATLEQPVLFNPMGGGDEPVSVEVVFLLLLDDIDKHLTLLKAVSKLIQDVDKMHSLNGENAYEVLLEVFASVEN